MEGGEGGGGVVCVCVCDHRLISCLFSFFIVSVLKMKWVYVNDFTTFT